MTKKPARKTVKRNLGRPSQYSLSLAQEITMRMMMGETIKSITFDKDMPEERTVYYWLSGRGLDEDNHTEFVQLFARAREIRAEMLFEEMLEIADCTEHDVVYDGDGNPVANHIAVNRDRLRVDTRKFHLMKVLPKFADRNILEGGNKPIEVRDMSAAEAARRIAMMMAEGKVEMDKMKREQKTEQP